MDVIDRGAKIGETALGVARWYVCRQDRGGSATDSFSGILVGGWWGLYQLDCSERRPCRHTQSRVGFTASGEPKQESGMRTAYVKMIVELGVLELAVQYDIVNVYVVPCCRTLRCRRYGRVWRRSGSLQSWKAVGGIYGLTISPCFPNW